jgi:YD repeat-containing protein
MKPLYCAIVVGMVLFASCNWNLPDSESSRPGPVITAVYETGETVEKESILYDGVPNSYSLRFIDDKTTRAIGQIQYYSVKDDLLSVSKYVRGSDGRVVLAAYYDNTLNLGSFDVYSYDTDGFVTGKYSYDGAGALQSVRLYAAKSTGTAKGQLESAAYYLANATTPAGGVRYYFIDTPSYASETWNMEVSYGSSAGEVAGQIWADDPYAGAINLTAIDAKINVKRELVAPSMPSVPSLSIPSDFSATSLTKAGYRFSFKDDYGSTGLSSDPNFFPLSASRTDKRINNGNTTVCAYLSRDDAGRITTQETYYGDTLALKVAITYDGSTWFPSSVTTTGAAMLLPLTYEIAYKASNHAVDSITVKSDTTSLIVLKYEYKTELPAQTALAVKNMDPFVFLNALLATDVVIYHYKGDGKTLVETFTAEPASVNGIAGIKVSVNLPKSDGSAGGEYNGSYIVGYNTSGQCASLQATDAADKPLWTQNTASVSDVWSSLSAAAPGVIDTAVSYGSMIESFIPANAASDVSSIVSGLSENFMYTMIF